MELILALLAIGVIVWAVRSKPGTQPQPDMTFKDDGLGFWIIINRDSSGRPTEATYTLYEEDCPDFYEAEQGWHDHMDGQE